MGRLSLAALRLMRVEVCLHCLHCLAVPAKIALGGAS
jgi:hypothetical protein